MKACDDAQRAADGAAVLDEVPAGRTGRARHGKIARLPQAVREALNDRLRDGLPTVEILAWLNSLPEAVEMLRKRFGGSEINEHNHSRWRVGGFAGWLKNQTTQEAIAVMGAACRNIKPAERDALTGQIATVVTARMVVELQRFEEMPEGPLKTAAWRDLVWSLVLLRRGEFYAGKLRLERDKLFPKKEEAEEPELCRQQMNEKFRTTFGLGGPRWNNFAKQWEGPGAAEMVEREEVERMVREELRRRKAAANPDKQSRPQINTDGNCREKTQKNAKIGTAG